LIETLYLGTTVILLPFIVAVAAYLVSHVPGYGGRVARDLCVLSAYLILGLTLIVSQVVLNVGPVMGTILTIPLPVGLIEFSLYLDGLALIPTVLSALFAALSLTFSVKYFSKENRYRVVSTAYNWTYSMMLIFLGAMLGACFTSNMIMLIVFWEITGLCSYALVAFWHEDPKSRSASMKTFIITHVGTLGFLLGAVVIFPVVGVLNFHLWSGSLSPTTIVVVSMVLFFIGILPKAVQFPLHTWLPDATIAPTPVTAYVHVVGFLMGLYAFPRFFGQVFAPVVAASFSLAHPWSLLFGELNIWHFLITFTGAVTLLVAVLPAIFEEDVKKLIAYILISSLGSTVMALGLGTSLGMIAGLYALIPHVIYCGILFFAVGAAIYRTGRTSLDGLGGLIKVMPVTTVCGAIGVLSWVGFPFLGYFTAFWLMIHALMEVKAIGLIVILLVGTVFKTVAIVRMFHSTFLGVSRQKPESREPPLFMLLPMVFLSIVILVVGVFPQILLTNLIIPAAQHLGVNVEIGISLGNIITASGIWNPLLGAATSIIYISIIGAFIFASRIAINPVSASAMEEASRLYAFGEDPGLLGHVSGEHIYVTLIDTLRIRQISDRVDVDRLYYGASKWFSGVCGRLGRLDVNQRYYPALLSFLGGAIILILLVVLGG